MHSLVNQGKELQWILRVDLGAGLETSGSLMQVLSSRNVGFKLGVCTCFEPSHAHPSEISLVGSCVILKPMCIQFKGSVSTAIHREADG